MALALSFRKFESPKQAQRIAFLRAHPDLLVDIPTEYEDVSLAQSARVQAVAYALISAKLLTRNTHAVSGSDAIRRLVRLAREEYVAAMQESS